MDALVGACTFDVPKALVESDTESRITAAREELKPRGVHNAESVPIPADAFTAESERCVRLGLVVSEQKEEADLKAKPEKVHSRRSEARRVRKEGVSTYRSRWSSDKSNTK